MYKSPLKVHGEYLIPKTAAQAAIAGTAIIRAGGSMGALEVALVAEGAVADARDPFVMNVGDTASIILKHSMDGDVWVDMPVWEETIAAPQDDPTVTSVSFEPGSVIARMALPLDAFTYVKGDVAFSAAPAGMVSLLPMYLPR